MAWEMLRPGSMPPQSLRFGDRDYWLVPTDDGRYGPQSKKDDPELQTFDSEHLKEVFEFKYTPLPKGKKRIRLLQLRSGTLHGSEIFCELVDADYDNPFHIPTRLEERMTAEGQTRANDKESRSNEEDTHTNGRGENTNEEETAPSG